MLSQSEFISIQADLYRNPATLRNERRAIARLVVDMSGLEAAAAVLHPGDAAGVDALKKELEYQPYRDPGHAATGS